MVKYYDNLLVVSATLIFNFIFSFGNSIQSQPTSAGNYLGICNLRQGSGMSGSVWFMED